MAKSVWTIARALIRGILAIFTRFKVEGLENLNGIDGPSILIANHISYLDPPVLAAALPKGFGKPPIRFLARKEIYLPVLSRLMTALGAVRLDTEKPLKTLKTALRLLGEGQTVAIFPEGTRALDGKLHEFMGGAEFLASKAGVPVVPVFIAGTFKTGEGYFNGFKKIVLFLVRAYQVKVVFGKPFHGDIREEYLGFYAAQGGYSTDKNKAPQLV